MSLKELMKDAYLNPKEGQVFVVSYAIFTTREQTPKGFTAATVCYNYDEALAELHRYICDTENVTYCESLDSLFAGKAVSITTEQFLLDNAQVRAVETVNADGDICRVDINLQ